MKYAYNTEFRTFSIKNSTKKRPLKKYKET